MTLDDVFADSAFVSQLGRLLRSHALRYFPLLRADADDLVNQTLQDLWRYASRSPGLLDDLTRDKHGVFAGDGWSAIVRVSVTILGRRAADSSRNSAGRWADESLSTHVEEESVAMQSGAPSLPRHLLLQQMLKVCIAELAQAIP